MFFAPFLVWFDQDLYSFQASLSLVFRGHMLHIMHCEPWLQGRILVGLRHRFDGFPEREGASFGFINGSIDLYFSI